MCSSRSLTNPPKCRITWPSDQVRGSAIERWLLASLIIGLAAALLLRNGWLWLAGYAFGSFIDWECTALADREFDVAASRGCTINGAGRFLGILCYPFYLVYRAYHRRLDPERFRYYQALRSWESVSRLTVYLVEQITRAEAGIPRIEKAWVHMIVKDNARLFHKITGIGLPSLEELVARHSAR